MISSLTPEIIYEDKDIIVCHKTCWSSYPEQPQLAQRYGQYFSKKSSDEKNTAQKKPLHANLYLAVIHRLTNR